MQPKGSDSCLDEMLDAEFGRAVKRMQWNQTAGLRFCPEDKSEKVSFSVADEKN